MTLAIMIIGWLLTLAIIIFASLLKTYLRRDAKNKLENKKQKDDSSEPIYKHWDTKIYYAFTNKQPELVAKKLGINAEKYYKNCAIIQQKPNLEGIIAIIGLSAISILWFVAIGLITGIWYVTILGLIVCVLCAIYPLKHVEEKAADVRSQLANEMPRFLDMMQTALYINLPVEEAIEITAKHLKGTLLADEFLKTLAEIQLGAYGWQTALENMSQKYEVDAFSDFVLDVVTAYDKGVSIYDVVVRQNKEIKQTNMLALKENANKLNSTILIPIAVFKLVPLIIMICIPIISQLRESGLF